MHLVYQFVFQLLFNIGIRGIAEQCHQSQQEFVLTLGYIDKYSAPAKRNTNIARLLKHMG
jgi:hypothetical protein